jgi:hypothetical protein
LIAQFLEARLRRWQLGDIIVKTSVGIGDRDRLFRCVQNIEKTDNLIVTCPLVIDRYQPWAVVPARKEQAMLRADAQRAVIREWLALPADDRFKFRYKGDRYQLIQVWLFKYVGLP